MRFSIVIPVNKPQWFNLTLHSLMNQSFPSSNYEILVIDDSGNQAKTVLEAASSKLVNFDVKLISCGEGRGRSIARNLGIKHATGEFTIILDDDMLTPPNFLATYDEYHSRGFSVVTKGIIGQILTIWFPNWFNSLRNKTQQLVLNSGVSELSQYIQYTPEGNQSSFIPILHPDALREPSKLSNLSFSPGNRLGEIYGDELVDLHIPWIIAGGCISADSQKLKSIGGYDENFSGWGFEDIELGYRLYKLGLHFAFGSKVTFLHQFHPASTETRMISNFRNYKAFCQKHPSTTVYLYCIYLAKQISVSALNSVAKRELNNQLTSEEISIAQKVYEKLISIDENYLAEYFNKHGNMDHNLRWLPLVEVFQQLTTNRPELFQ